MGKRIRKYGELDRKYQNDYRKRQKMAAMELLGGICKRCGFSDSRALQVDHINGGGTAEIFERRGSSYWNTVIKSVLNKEGKYQLLCANCNWIKRWENNEAKGRPIKTKTI